MKRLTTDDEMSIMFSLNTFYAKDGEVWVRGGGPKPDYKDVTLVEWIRSAASKHGLAFTADDPENLGDEMYDALQDGDETVEGILALMHAAAVQAAEMRGRLQPIENILGDDYDLDRLRDLVEADMDGRCIIAPVKPGEVAWCGFVQRDPVSGATKNIVYPVVLKGWWTGLKCKESDPRLFLFGELHESEEAAEAALKGEQE